MQYGVLLEKWKTEEIMGKDNRPRVPTREEKKQIAKAGLDWKNWLVTEQDNISFTVLSKKSGRKRVILK